MKKLSLLLLTLTLCFFTACHKSIWEELENLDQRVTKLEELCKEMNTNIISIQTIVNVQQSGDYITGIVEIKKDGEVIGYTITFANHEPITIYHGQDGKDGADGKDTDGVYYWTLNGEWLLDENGNKLPVSGEDGKDGTMPQLKIEEGYWYVSYDNGATWTQLDKAVGDNGQDGNKGDKGDKGEDGDSMFQSVTQDENYVYFTLADGTVIRIAKGKGDDVHEGSAIQIIDGAIMAEFSVSETKKVYFSMGNLLYSPEGTHECADGTTQPGTWRFAEKQWEEGTMLYWGNSGYLYDVQLPPEAVSYSSLVNIKLYANCGNDIQGTYYDFGKYNAILNGKNTPSTFRLLTDEEWEYLLNHRPNAKQLKGNICVDNKKGMYLLPDSWTHIGSQLPSVVYSNEKQIFEQFIPFKELEDRGVVFLLEQPYASTSIEERYNMYQVKYYRGSVLSIADGGIMKLYIARAPGTYNASDQVYAVHVRLVKDVE